MKQVSIQELKATLSSAGAEAEAGATIVITRHGAPVAQLSPAERVHLVSGARVGKGKLSPAVSRSTGGRYLDVLPEDRERGRHGGSTRSNPLTRCVTLDAAQRQAARELSLPV